MDIQEAVAVHIRITDDGLQALALLDADSPGIEPDAVREALASAGVTVGILDDALPSINAHQETVVARGTAPLPGTDGRLELLASPTQEEKGDESGRAPRPVLPLRNVLSGKPVARLHPPQPGTPGTTVRGATVAAPPARPAAAHAGAGVAASPTEPGLFVATRDGHLLAGADGQLTVEDVLVLHKDVDYSVGDITFVGSVVIQGDITGDAHLTISKNLEVTGDVADAAIQVGGDVVIRRGFLGRGVGTITAGGSVTVQHVLNQTIHAAVDVHIIRESVNGTIHAGKRIMAVTAVVTGGTLDAEEYVEVQCLGRSEGSQAKVHVGRRGKMLERMNVLEKDLRQAEKNAAEIKDAVYKLVRLKIDKGHLPPEQEQLLAKLQGTQKQLPAAIEAMKKEKTDLTAQLAQAVDAKLKVADTVHDNVFIEINGARKLTDSALTGVVFVERNGAIEASGC